MKLCMGCMNEIEEKYAVCPMCGFDEKNLVQESYYLNPGTIVGNKYIVGKVLSYGGFSVTYLGWDAENGRKVTIREYLPSDFSTRAKGDTDVTIYSGDALEQYEQGLTTFLNEGNIIEHLPEVTGIARVYDCLVENETGYIVSEYLQGNSLKEILDAGKKYEWDEALMIIRPLLEGLKQIHSHSVMHYDIAPENVILSERGEVKLINFGATKYSTTSNSKSLAIILKPGYAPEEQYRSMGEKGPWSDVYAVAALLYRMVTGVVPEESVERALVDHLKAPSELGVKVSKAPETALLNALNVYREKRTASAGEFLEELSSDNVKRIVEKKNKMETGKFPTWAKGLIAGLLCIIVAGSIFIIKNKNKDTGNISSQTLTMIDTEGMDAEEAKAAIEKLGAGCQIQYTPDDDPEGTIWMQSVEAGKAMDANTVVTLMASGGNSKLTIPDDWIDQEKYDDIEKRLKDYNIKIDITEEEDSSTERKGYHLISQILIDGEKVTEEVIQNGEAVFKANQNKEITFVYYKPNKKNFEFDIPDFTGKELDEVEKTKSRTGVLLKDLDNSGYDAIPVYGKDLTLNKVVDQSQKGNKVKLSAENALKVYYAKKVLEYKAGDDPNNLKTELKTADIKVSIIEDKYSDTCPKGTIYSVIYPNGKNYAKAGDTVVIHLSKGKKPVTPTKAPVQSKPTDNQQSSTSRTIPKTTAAPKATAEPKNNEMKSAPDMMS